MIRGTNRIMFDFADRFRAHPNTLSRRRRRKRAAPGNPAQQIAAGWWELAPDEAAVIDFTPPKCRYWSFTLSNYWGQSLDYARHPHARERAQRRLARGRLGAPDRRRSAIPASPTRTGSRRPATTRACGSSAGSRAESRGARFRSLGSLVTR
jgi:hypothetical protein